MNCMRGYPWTFSVCIKFRLSRNYLSRYFKLNIHDSVGKRNAHLSLKAHSQRRVTEFTKMISQNGRSSNEAVPDSCYIREPQLNYDNINRFYIAYFNILFRLQGFVTIKFNYVMFTNAIIHIEMSLCLIFWTQITY